MKELFDKVLRAIPAYLSHVLELLSGPKTFIGRKNLTAPRSAVEAYTFLGVTLVLVLTAEVALLPEQKDYLLTFASHAVQAVFFLVVMVAVLFAIWRVVGGRLSFRLFFIVTCYLSGISTLIFALFALLAGGVLKHMDPDTASGILSGAPPVGMPDPGVIAYGTLIAIGFAAVYVWIIVGWGAYRSLNNVSRARSAIALALFTLTLPGLMFVQYLIERSSMPAPERSASGRELPPEIVGLWRVVYAAGSTEAPSTEGSSYSFTSSGEYFTLRTTVSRQEACTLTTEENSYGHASVDARVLTLVPLKHTRRVSSSCSTDKTETALDLDKEIYPFEVRQQSTGWVLCLSGRYGQQCLSAAKLPSQ